LQRQIAELEARISQLSQAKTGAAVETLTAPAPTKAAAPARPAPKPLVSGPPVANLSQPQLPAAKVAPASDLYNEFGVRKFDLAGAWQRLADRFREPQPANPQLLKYLATGGLPGMRSLRRETRKARNRFLLLALLFAGILYIVLGLFLRTY